MFRLKKIFDLKLFCLLVCFFLVSFGCGGLKYQNMTPQQKSLWMMTIYNSQYANYMSKLGYSFDDESNKWVQVINQIKFTQEENDALKIKKQTLTKLFSLIKIYKSGIVAGVPPVDTEQDILEIIDNL